MIRREYGQSVMEQILDDLSLSLYYQQNLSLDEHNIYGSSRLGIKEENIPLYQSRFQSTSMDTITGAFVKTDETTTISELDTLYSQRVVGQKKYELSNHLGNVLAVVSDKIVYAGDTTIIEGLESTLIPRWEAYIAQAQDYYPFGMQLPDRIYSDTVLAEEVVFNVTSFTKTVSDKDFKFSTQGYVKAYASDTATVGGRMKITTTALNGNVWQDYPTKIGSKYKVYVAGDPNESDSFYIKIQRRSPQALISEHLMVNGVIEFEFTAVSATTRIRPRRADQTNQGTMVSYIDRIMLKEIRDTLYQDSVIMATSNGYRYGFNGMERDDEWNGLGNSYDFGARIYDSRVGRWLSLDPKMHNFSDWTPYNFALARPIQYLDPDGETPITGAVLGALSEYIAQVGVNYFVEKQSFSDALLNINGWDIGVAATFGLASGGISAIKNTLANPLSKRLFKKVVKFSIEGLTESLENVAKSVVNEEDIDIMAALSGGFLEAGLGGLIPKPKFFKRKAENAQKAVDKANDKMKRGSWEKRSQNYRDKWTERKDIGEKAYKLNIRTANSIETVTSAYAEGGANALLDESLYKKPKELNEVIIRPNETTVKSNKQ
mgnify:CR=1 FL=1